MDSSSELAAVLKFKKEALAGRQWHGAKVRSARVDGFE
jgi:hypothetical protein